MLPLFSTAYLPSVEYIKALFQFDEIAIEQWEYFPKQTMRNRCFILSPNGVQSLSIPVHHDSGKKQFTKDIKISNAEPWQRAHWRTFIAAYNRSPFFEFYIDDFSVFYHKSYKWLLEFNIELMTFMCNAMKHPLTIDLTLSYQENIENDFRPLCNIHSDKSDNQIILKKYNQVFTYKYGFTPNLSITDLIFNTGNQATDYIRG